MEFKSLIKKRHSVRRYSTNKPDWRKIIKAIDAARYVPLAGNMMNCRFILISDERKIQQLAQASQQGFVKDAHYVVAVVSDDSKLTQSYDERGEKFARQQSGAAIQNFLLALTDLDLVTCWVGYFDEQSIKHTLKIPADHVVEAIFPIGKPTKIKTQEKRKTDLDNVLYFDTWKNKYMEPKSKLTRVAD